MSQVSPLPVLTFQSITLDVIDRGGQPWITLSQVATALYKGGGQSDVPFAVRNIQKLFARHADEFTDSMTAVVKLPTAGGEQDVRIFSLRGCHLLAMFARTPVAKEFRRWVLDVLDNYISPVPAPRPATSTERVRRYRERKRQQAALSKAEESILQWVDHTAPVTKETTGNAPVTRGPQEQALWQLLHDFGQEEAKVLRAFQELADRVEHVAGHNHLDALGAFVDHTHRAFNPDHITEVCIMPYRLAKEQMQSAMANLLRYVKLSLNFAIIFGK